MPAMVNECPWEQGPAFARAGVPHAIATAQEKGEAEPFSPLSQVQQAGSHSPEALSHVSSSPVTTLLRLASRSNPQSGVLRKLLTLPMAFLHPSGPWNIIGDRTFWRHHGTVAHCEVRRNRWMTFFHRAEGCE
jgi:hypothetical protein